MDKMNRSEFVKWWHAGCDAHGFPMSERNEEIAWLNYQKHGEAAFPSHQPHLLALMRRSRFTLV